jgi:hypothetical protein
MLRVLCLLAVLALARGKPAGHQAPQPPVPDVLVLAHSKPAGHQALQPLASDPMAETNELLRQLIAIYQRPPPAPSDGNITARGRRANVWSSAGDLDGSQARAMLAQDPDGKYQLVEVDGSGNLKVVASMDLTASSGDSVITYCNNPSNNPIVEECDAGGRKYVVVTGTDSGDNAAILQLDDTRRAMTLVAGDDSGTVTNLLVDSNGRTQNIQYGPDDVDTPTVHTPGAIDESGRRHVITPALYFTSTDLGMDGVDVADNSSSFTASNAMTITNYQRLRLTIVSDAAWQYQVKDANGVVIHSGDDLAAGVMVLEITEINTASYTFEIKGGSGGGDPSSVTVNAAAFIT